MARTTQNAKKTTSGSARRVQLSVKCARMIAGSTAKDISSRAAKGKSTKRTSRSMSTESISSLSSLTTLPSSPVHRAILLDSSREMLPWATNRYCYICHDGSKCLEEVKPELYASDIKFKCPSCHELREHEVKCKLSPYHAFMRNVDGELIRVLDAPTTLVGVCERALKAQVCAESILILHLVCVGMEVRGSLPKLLHTTLEEYHTADSLTYEEVTFDFGTERKLDRWTKRAELLRARLEGRNFGRKIIFVTVHSVVTRGDLFAGKDKDGDVAMTVEDFMDYLFISPLNEVVYGSTLFMLTCGHVTVLIPTSLQPEYTILFTAPELIVAATKLFAVAYSIQVLIHGHSFLDIFHDLLNVSLDLRMHTDVLVFYISSLLAPKAPFGLRNPALDVAQPPSIVGY
ncbi:hypothetical protein PISMIDRAFT_6530 [Pisolithus microcarpus 441]|uniref:Uncharacterized protein n=1 Tax=Pisolithus microcarpus 441 TaxID=765257 RepID=A0A0C9YX97_9AGAM|nr:hypothetical protein PISMIDRAFT_6530 [Pisolithus microcarpus 441]